MMAWRTAGWLVGCLTNPRLDSKFGVGWLDCLAGQIGWLAEPLAKQLAYLSAKSRLY